ncbi:MAG: transporter substrate-binding domain-containing protein [Oscillospiraceae bacterium]|nr:transporter substrate-binding domain-containing protein [Oscillospiraceae bacterium]
MKKILALLLALAMIFAFAACGDKDTPAPSSGTNLSEVPPAQSDLDYVKGKGTLIVGITNFAPMDYPDANGEWIGFDAEMAQAFGAYLGVDIVFQEIDWDNKVFELDGKTIDAVWNGMTLTDAVKAAMETSKPYCNNAQVVIVKADVADQYQTVESLAGLTFAVEAGSAGQEQAIANNLTCIEVLDQATALLEVKSGTADAAIIDALMAGAMVGEGTDYTDLTYTVGLNSEEYGVGFRKGSELAAELNAFFAAAYADGSMQACAEKYGVQASLIPQ